MATRNRIRTVHMSRSLSRPGRCGRGSHYAGYTSNRAHVTCRLCIRLLLTPRQTGGRG
jgi:hypothetical protein